MLAPYRVYDPRFGRWISRDPIGEVGGINLFLYTYSNPLNLVDPTGAAPMDYHDEVAWAIDANTPEFDNFWANFGTGLLANAMKMPTEILTLGRGAAEGWEGYSSEPCGGELSNLQRGLAFGGDGLIVISTIAPTLKGFRALKAFKHVDDLCSFPAGTVVYTPDGAVPIESLQVGDWVIASDPTTGEESPLRVIDTMSRESAVVMEITTSNGPIVASREHPFWVLDTGWRRADELEPGMILEVASGDPVIINAVVELPEPATVYNISVENIPTYLAGPQRLVVHNCGYVDELAKAKELFPKLADLPDHQHHIFPKYLGGPVNGPTTPLIPAYHQVITNEFRRIAPYGQNLDEILSPTQKAGFMKDVYDKFPLPPGTTY